MYRLLALFLVITSYVEASGNGTKCNGFNANFELARVIGTWYVVAIIPEAIFPDKQKVPCYEVEFTEIEESGLRWLMNQTHTAPHPKDIFEENKGVTIRQRYRSDHPFDVWSKSLDGANGCFQQVMSLNTDLSDIKRALSHEARMQLHLIETGKESGPFLLQMLWGNLITGVIYQKQQSTTPDKLKPVSEVMVKLRGPQRAPKMCDKRLKD
ncbi:uncharacterized protein isoform X2 [Choristoneura fumiferana]|uniref:uncharacterized protein isoform X2 n=1 Tax=Choristoneura fumiferana TaxID=7141 RepID=UPI003D15B44C